MVLVTFDPEFELDSLELLWLLRLRSPFCWRFACPGLPLPAREVSIGVSRPEKAD